MHFIYVTFFWKTGNDITLLMVFFVLCPMSLFAPFSISYPNHSWIAHSFSHIVKWTRKQISWTLKIKGFVFNIFSPVKQDSDISWKGMLPQWVSSLTLPQRRDPTHHISPPCVSAQALGIEQKLYLEQCTKYYIQHTKKKEKKKLNYHVPRSSLNIPKIDFFII